jgi:hypothetical protein
MFVGAAFGQKLRGRFDSSCNEGGCAVPSRNDWYFLESGMTSGSLYGVKKFGFFATRHKSISR